MFRRKRKLDDFAAEIDTHLEHEIARLREQGLTEAEARTTARREFGNVTRAREQFYESRRWLWLDHLAQDIRFGLRMLRKSPGFTAVAVLTLALGIGANTAIFSVVNSALLRPLSYSEPEQLYLVREVVPQLAKFYATWDANIPDFRIWQKRVHSFHDVAIAESTSADLTRLGEPELIRGVRASANVFSVLGAEPVLGRAFRPEEDENGRGNVVILTDSFWRARFHSEASVLGKTLVLDDVPREIVGVLPASFRFPATLGGSGGPSPIAFFQPLDGVRDYEQPLIGEFDFKAVARLKRGVTPEQALAELNLVQAEIAKQANEGVDLKGALLPLEAEVVGPARRGLLLLLGAVGAVLLIVCANLASLLLSRVPGRMREAAIRLAIGATRSRVMRQMLTETFLLSFISGGIGVLITVLGVKWFVQVAPAGIPRLDEVQVDGRVLVFALICAMATGALFGILPAWRVTQFRPLDALKSGVAATTESRRTRRLREGLVGFEVALTTLLMILAGLLVSSLGRLLNVHAGFATQDVLVASVDLPPQSYSAPNVRLHFYDQVLAGIQSLPGVRAVGWISIPPLGGEGSVTGIRLPGQPMPNAERPVANYRPVSADYFSAMGIPIMQGKILSSADLNREVVVVSQSVADKFWPGKNPIGQTCVTEWGPETPAEVIGVVGDIRTVRLDEQPLMMVYVPYWFNSRSIPTSASIILRTAGDPESSASAVREVIHHVDAEVPITSLRPMTQIVSQSVESRRFPTFLALSFALSSLLLASLGVFGVVAYSVAQRRHELGIRVALGADLRDLLGMTMRQGMTPVAIGLAAGVVGAFLAGRLVSSLLFGVTAYDSATLTIVVLAVAAVALLACYIPARRAMGVDPMIALRHE